MAVGSWLAVRYPCSASFSGIAHALVAGPPAVAVVRFLVAGGLALDGRRLADGKRHGPGAQANPRAWPCVDPPDHRRRLLRLPLQGTPAPAPDGAPVLQRPGWRRRSQSGSPHAGPRRTVERLHQRRRHRLRHRGAGIQPAPGVRPAAASDHPNPAGCAEDRLGQAGPRARGRRPLFPPAALAGSPEHLTGRTGTTGRGARPGLPGTPTCG
ncbi:hypothetical protein D3C81_1012200 [compost metagenome]